MINEKELCPVLKKEKSSVAKEKRHLSSETLFFNDAERYPILTEKEIADLIKDREIAKKNGDEKGFSKTIERLVNCNLRLVMKIVSNDFRECGLPFSDILSCGSVALVKAMKGFDPDKGKLSVYLKWWMKHEIYNEISKYHPSRIVSSGANKSIKVSKVVEFINKYECDNGHYPTNQQISEACNIKEKSVDDYVELSQRRRVSLDEVENMPVCVDENIFNNQNIKIAKMAFECLNNSEKIIIQHRFGLNGYVEMTLKEIGVMLGITPERVRQIQIRAISKMKEEYSKLNVRW